MRPTGLGRDLIVLAADKNIDFGLRGLLGRPKALGVRSVAADFLVHPRRDPGCVREAHDVLRPSVGDYRHALVVFDHQGSGRDTQPIDRLADEVRDRLAANGWGGRAEVIVLDPELEVWVFADSPHVEHCLGWRRGRGTLRRWLEARKLWAPGRAKPEAPREALDEVLRELRRPRSSALYRCIAERVSLAGCTDPAFRKLASTLARWFPPPAVG